MSDEVIVSILVTVGCVAASAIAIWLAAREGVR